MTLHLFMLVCFDLSLRSCLSSCRRYRLVCLRALRHSSSAPYACGSPSLALCPLCVVASYEGDPTIALLDIQRPFFIGSSLSLVAIAVYFVARALNSNTRNA